MVAPTLRLFNSLSEQGFGAVFCHFREEQAPPLPIICEFTYKVQYKKKTDGRGVPWCSRVFSKQLS